MCRWGETVKIEIGGREVVVDKCIAPIVKALNVGGIPTLASCCGHGNCRGNILLQDGRTLWLGGTCDKANDVQRWLDNGWHLVMWRNPAMTYSAALVRREDFNMSQEALFDVQPDRITNSRLPLHAIEIVTEKPLFETQ